MFLISMLFAPAAWAQGLCSYDNPAQCGSPGVNNLSIGGTLTTQGGGTLNGSFNFTTAPTINGNPIPSQSVTVVTTLACDGSTNDSTALQAAINGAAAGTTLFIPNKGTCLLNNQIVLSTNNITINGNGWATLFKRGVSLSNPLFNVTGSGILLQNFAIDGNTSNTTNLFTEVNLDGTNDVAQHLMITNARARAISLQAAGDRATGNYIVGLSDPAIQSYGIWAISGAETFIDHNYIVGSGIDGIGADGNGTMISDNHLAVNHCYTGVGGGQIAVYNTANNAGISIIGNTIDTGCGSLSHGIEVAGVGATIAGNSIRDQEWNGIALDAAASNVTITGNTVINSGLAAGLHPAGLVLAANVSDVVINGNTFSDTQGVSATQAYGIYITAGTSNNITITGNKLTGNVTGPIFDGGSGLNKAIAHNVGIEDVQPSVASAATVSFPINPTFALTGTTGVTAISGEAWTGRQVTIIPDGAVTFTAGTTILASYTTTANVPVLGVYNGSKWVLK